jgi:hypothetical protein
MNYQNIEYSMKNLYNFSYIQETERKTDKDPRIIQIPFKQFKDWLKTRLNKKEMEELANPVRMVCVICKSKIHDDKYFVVPHPDFLGDYTKTLWFHSKGKCDPRLAMVRAVREQWLENHFKQHY